MAFHLYAATVKNLRGVVYSELSEKDAEEKVKWLVKRFRYRNLGVTQDFTAKYAFVKKYIGKPFIELHYPTAQLANLTSELKKHLGEAAEYIALASIYVSPVIVLGEPGELEKYAVDRIYTEKELDDKLWKLHMRIVDYSVLDFYHWSTSMALDALKWAEKGKEKKVEEALSERRNRISQDKKRYWRIQSNSGRVIVLYLDLLFKVISNKDLLKLFLKHSDVSPATLAIVTALVVS